MRIFTPMALLALGVACSGNVGVDLGPQCNGQLDPDETEIDDLFDRDRDGAYDLEDGCDRFYPPEQLDCDDEDPNVGPHMEEVQCNGVDDDCDDATPEDDGFGCHDGYNGTFDVTPAPSYQCAGQVDINFAQLDVFHDEFILKMTPVGGTQPEELDGTVSAENTFRVSETLAGGCTEAYVLEGSFSDPNNFTATFTATFTDNFGGLGCGGCSDQSWELTGTR